LFELGSVRKFRPRTGRMMVSGAALFHDIPSFQWMMEYVPTGRMSSGEGRELLGVDGN
jgi:hypothetical protein